MSNALTSAAADSAPTVKECLSAHREAQTLRKQFRLLESRLLLAECSNSSCPGPVKRDCLRWSDEVTQQLASVAFRLQSQDGDTSPHKVKIYVDDELRFKSLPPRAVEFNPGTYRFKFVIDGKVTVEQSVVLGEAEKFKSVSIKLPSKQHEVAPTGGETQPDVPPVAPGRPIPIASLVFGGIAAAGVISFAAWGLASRSLKTELENECAPNCEQEYIDRVKTRALIADISLGVGIASLATGTILYFAWSKAEARVDVGVNALPQGGFMGTFQLKAF